MVEFCAKCGKDADKTTGEQTHFAECPMHPTNIALNSRKSAMDVVDAPFTQPGQIVAIGKPTIALAIPVSILAGSHMTLPLDKLKVIVADYYGTDVDVIKIVKGKIAVEFKA